VRSKKLTWTTALAITAAILLLVQVGTYTVQRLLYFTPAAYDYFTLANWILTLSCIPMLLFFALLKPTLGNRPLTIVLWTFLLLLLSFSVMRGQMIQGARPSCSLPARISENKGRYECMVGTDLYIFEVDTGSILMTPVPSR
jgi:hypothetical protein